MNIALLVAVIALGAGVVGLSLAIVVNRRSATAVRAVEGRLDGLRDNVDDQSADLSQRVDRLLGTQRDLFVRVTGLIDEVSRLAGDQESQAVDILATFARLEQCETRLSKLTAVIADAADAAARLADESKADRAKLGTEMGDLLFRQSDLLRAEIVAAVAQRTVRASPRGGANTKG